MEVNKLSLDWSLKPLFTCVKLVGINPPASKPTKRSNFFILIIITTTIFLLNIVINGPRILDVFKSSFIKQFMGCEVSPWSCTKAHPELLLTFTYQIAVCAVVSFIPVIHLVFFFKSLRSFSHFRDLWLIVMKIHREIKLSKTFYKDCRKKCLFAILLLLLVRLVH